MRVRNFMCCLLLGFVAAVPFAFAEEQASISRLPPLTKALKIQLETDGRLTVPGEC